MPQGGDAPVEKDEESKEELKGSYKKGGLPGGEKDLTYVSMPFMLGGPLSLGEVFGYYTRYGCQDEGKSDSWSFKAL